MTPENIVNRYSEKTLEKIKEQKLDQSITKEFADTLRQTANLKNLQAPLHGHPSHGERIFGAEEQPFTMDPNVSLLQIVLTFAAKLRREKIIEANYFELFNILFGLPQLPLDAILEADTQALYSMINRKIEQAKVTPVQISSLNRKRQFQFFLERHIREAEPKSNNSSGVISTYDAMLSTTVQDSMKVTQILSNEDEIKQRGAQGLQKIQLGVNQKLHSFGRDFLGGLLALINTMDRGSPLEVIFKKALDSVRIPHFNRKGDEVVFELINLYRQIVSQEAVNFEVNFLTTEATSNILRWVVGQYLRAPLSTSPLAEPTIKSSFNIELFSNTALMNICSQLKNYGFKFEPLLALCYSGFDACEKSAWTACAHNLAEEAAPELFANNSLMTLAINAGISKPLLEFALAQYCLSTRHFDQAIIHLLHCHDYNRALTVFLNTQLEHLTKQSDSNEALYFRHFKAATLKINERGAPRKIVDVLSIYFQFVDFMLESPDSSDLKTFFAELISRLPLIADSTQAEQEAIRLILNDVVRRSVAWCLEETHANDRKLLDREVLSMLNSSSTVREYLTIDSSLAQELIEVCQ